jgi:hypothetical protein
LLFWQAEKVGTRLKFVLPCQAAGSSPPIKFCVPNSLTASAFSIAVYKSMGADCQQGIHVSFLMEEAAVMHVDVKLPLVV